VALIFGWAIAKTNRQDTVFLLAILSAFLSLGISLLAPRIALYPICAVLTALAAVFAAGTISNLLFAIGVANAFNPREGGYGWLVLYSIVLLGYYGFAVISCFSRLPKLHWILAAHFVLAPLIAIFQQPRLFASGILAYRFLMVLCFVLLWLRMYDLRRARTRDT
jgi:hypothetical protein